MSLPVPSLPEVIQGKQAPLWEWKPRRREEDGERWGGLQCVGRWRKPLWSRKNQTDADWEEKREDMCASMSECMRVHPTVYVCVCVCICVCVRAYGEVGVLEAVGDECVRRSSSDVSQNPLTSPRSVIWR